MLNLLRSRRVQALIGAGLTPAILAVGCFQLAYNFDIAWQSNQAGGMSASVRDISASAGDPNGDYDGRDVMWNDLSNVASCKATDANGQPGYGWPGYGGFTPPTAQCLTDWQAEITDDPADTNANEPMAYICNAGARHRDCAGSGADAPPMGEFPTGQYINPWFRNKFAGGVGSQGRWNMEQLIYAVRDYYVATITDPSIQPPGNPTATGQAGCISITDHMQTDVSATGNLQVTLRRLCF